MTNIHKNGIDGKIAEYVMNTKARNTTSAPPGCKKAFDEDPESM